jgi:single-stranded DNA-specific DHH superfamily exonuclease
MRFLLGINQDIEIFTETGEIGKYYLTPGKIKDYENIQPDHIILCDYALPTQDILDLKDISEDLIIFDHHKQEEIKQAVHINPFLSKDADGLMYPSTGWVINIHLDQPQEILSVLGAIGDQEELIKPDNAVGIVLEENGLDFDQAQEIVVNIDSCYIAGDGGQIKRMVKLLSGDAFDVKSLLDARDLLDNRKRISSTIREIVEGDKEIDGDRKIVYASYESNYHIISNITRDLARKFPEYLIIVVSYKGTEEANIYFRSRRDIDLRPVIGLAHKRGYNSGGKKEVAGVILPRENTSSFILEAENILDL